LQKCAELVMELCRADSAGISLLEPGGEHGRFRWQAIVGAFAGYWGGTVPREASPCGVVIARDSVLLFRQAERFFPALNGMEPRIHETLLAPWHRNGTAVGTLWAIKHSPDGRFDAEDARLLQSLARLAAAASQMNDALDDAKAGQEALRESEERFRSLVESWAQAVWETDAEGRVITDSPSWRTYTGQSLEEYLGSGWANAIHPDDRAAVQQLWREAVRERRSLNAEYRLRRTEGSWRWTNDHAAPLLAPDGTVRKWVGMNVDITERKEAEEALRVSESRARLLLGELQHRVRNTLSVIRSITRRTAETSKSVEDYAMHLDGRINAFARVQTALARDPTAGLDLTELVADELLTYAAHQGEQVRIAGPSVRLKPRAAETFGLAVHELATNAVKHGALSVPQGRIRISWRVQNGSDPPQLAFEWKESGTPERAAKRKRRGFGTDLLERTLTYELKAKTVQTFEPDGLRCTIELPMTERLVMGNLANTPQQD
jgi:PAS domain S-box-containing protein